MQVAYLRCDSTGNRNDSRRIKSEMRESHLKGEPTIYTVYIMGNGAPSYEDPLGMT